MKSSRAKPNLDSAASKTGRNNLSPLTTIYLKIFKSVEFPYEQERAVLKITACDIMSKKRRRDQPAVDTQLVAIYEDLANIDEEIRLKAAHSLLTRFVAGGTPSADQLNEILRRLIRGLCSGRKAARLGFSVALTEFLRIVFGPKKDSVSAFLDIAELPKNLVDLTGVSGDASGQVCKIKFGSNDMTLMT